MAPSCANNWSQCRSSSLFDRCNAYVSNFDFLVWRQMFLQALLLPNPVQRSFLQMQEDIVKGCIAKCVERANESKYQSSGRFFSQGKNGPDNKNLDLEIPQEASSRPWPRYWIQFWTYGCKTHIQHWAVVRQSHGESAIHPK